MKRSHEAAKNDNWIENKEKLFKFFENTLLKP